MEFFHLTIQQKQSTKKLIPIKKKRGAQKTHNEVKDDSG